jgi:hypothetical protein
MMIYGVLKNSMKAIGAWCVVTILNENKHA